MGDGCFVNEGGKNFLFRITLDLLDQLLDFAGPVFTQHVQHMAVHEFVVWMFFQIGQYFREAQVGTGERGKASGSGKGVHEFEFVAHIFPDYCFLKLIFSVIK